MEQVEQDPDFITLSRQFKATAMELISVLEQVKLLVRIYSNSLETFLGMSISLLVVLYNRKSMLKGILRWKQFYT